MVSFFDVTNWLLITNLFIHFIEHGLELKEKNDIIHGPSLELLQFMEKDVDLMEEIQTDAKEIMKIQTLLEPVVGVLLQVS